MAVRQGSASALRALLAMHFQSGWNRSVKELGKQGVWALVLLGGVLLAFAVAPMMVGPGILGWMAGRNLDQPWTVPSLGATLGFLSLGGGLINGILGGTRVLAWERLKGFPLRLSTLFTAELVAGIGDLLPLLMSLSILSLALGIGAARPLLAPLALLAAALSIALMLTVQLLVGGLAEALMKRLRLLLFLAGALVWGVSVLSSSMHTLGPKGPRDAAFRHPTAQQQAQQREQVLGLARRLGQIVEPLPSTQQMRALQDASQGRWDLAALRQVYPLALLLMLGWAAARILQKEAASGSLQTPVKGPEKLWTFGAPEAGVARLQWKTLVGSALGRFGFAIPLMAVVLIRGPFSRLGGQGGWVVPTSFAYLALSSTQLLFNQFGLDGPAARGLLLLPIQGRVLLKGKMMGFASFYGVQAAILLLLLIVLGQRDPVALTSGVLLMGCLILAMGSLGQWASVWMPRPMPRNTLKNNAMPLPLLLISLFGTMGLIGILGGLYALLAWLAPASVLPAFAALFAAFLAGHAFALGLNAAYLDKHRERLVENLG